MRKLLPFLLLLLVGRANSQTPVDTIDVYSKAMHKQVKTSVVFPAGYSKGKDRYPVLYLLHGYGGSYNNFLRRIPEIKEYGELYKLIIVCPDGGFNSWYIDSPVDSSVRYETFVSSELIAFIDSHYRTKMDAASRGISGLSMGGHGALMLAMRHPETFGVATSVSGAVDLDAFKTKFDIIKKFGDTASHAATWNAYSVMKIADTIMPGRQQFLLDCGTADDFLSVNRALHLKLLQRNIKHDYTERDGAHNWDYWSNAFAYHFLFISRFFRQDK